MEGAKVKAISQDQKKSVYWLVVWEIEAQWDKYWNITNDLSFCPTISLWLRSSQNQMKQRNQTAIKRRWGRRKNPLISLIPVEWCMIYGFIWKGTGLVQTKILLFKQLLGKVASIPQGLAGVQNYWAIYIIFYVKIPVLKPYRVIFLV